MTPVSDASAPRYFLLDMGKEKYGDCILCLVGGKTILIDGGHEGDFDGQDGSDSLPDQIGKVLNATPPYDLDLLVVTHCHLDHIGCLPKMVEQRVITAKWALVADEKLGWGKRVTAPDTSVLPDSPTVARVVAALREEPRADDFEDDAALDRFLSDAAGLEQDYKDMLKTLDQRGTKIVRYGRDSTNALVSAFSGTGLKILGPTNEHLEICRKAIAASMQDAIEDATRIVSSDATAPDIEIYRHLATSAVQDAGADVSRLGSALNDQSIILSLGSATRKVLLTGDMQFSDPAVNNLDNEMTTLRQKVIDAGPYKFIKLSHHGSHNGLDDDLLNAWSATKFFGISGGSNDSGHPARDVLDLLKDKQGISWARTDKNGLITINPSAATSKVLQPSKGNLNDSRTNPKPPRRRRDDEPLPISAATLVQGKPGSLLEITARIPDHLSRVVITIESETRSGFGVSASPRPGKTPSFEPEPIAETTDPRPGTLGGGRSLPPLLFASNRKALAENIGRAEADKAIAMIADAGQAYVDVQDSASSFDRVRENITDAIRGVVLLGGYDVLPARRLDTLPQELRETLGDDATDDADNFIVWSDAVYGDKDDDNMPELPVSRIPDGNSSKLVLNALQARSIDAAGGRFTLYNAKRPFATDIIELIRGNAKSLISLPSTVDDVEAEAVQVPLVYLMLHGMDNDATLFTGQEPEYPEAFHIDNVPKNGGGLVFTGCCWGALTVRQRASRVRAGRSLTVRTPDQSIALRFLEAGYNAFVGCTGSHYSPPEAASLTHGKPMHVDFWQKLMDGLRPAEALFQAKIEYLRRMPHGLEDVWDIAVEHKILRQFTCLGLGW